MRVEPLSDHDGLPTLMCIASLEEMPSIVTVTQRGCSIAWFIGSAGDFQDEDLHQPFTAIIGLCPNLVHIFGRAAERVHDELDRALRAANQFALTLWSERYTANEAVFDIFRVDFPEEPTADCWSSRVIILDERLPAEEQGVLLEKLRDPDRSIREYLART